MKRFLAPDIITEQYTTFFLKNVTSIFKMNANCMIPDVHFITSNVKKIDILGLLLLYKFFEYTVKKQLFVSPQCDLGKGTYVRRVLEEYGMDGLLTNFVQMQPPNQYGLRYKDGKDFFIAPTVLSNGAPDENDYIPKVNEYYAGRSVLSGILTTCLGEIKSNFKEHAIGDTKAILMAEGNRKVFSMACVDTGIGILSSFRGTRYETLCKTDLLKRTIERGITSKEDSFHIGSGLWIVSEIAKQYKGTMRLFSEGAYLIIRNGKMKVGECANWKGTIFYLNIPLNNPKSLTEILRK